MNFSEENDQSSVRMLYLGKYACLYLNISFFVCIAHMNTRSVA